MPYFVIHTKTNHELLAATMLEAHLGLDPFLPQVLQRRHGRLAPLPLFPGYLFVRATGDRFVRSQVDGQPGVIRVVTVDARPCTVEDAVVDVLRTRVDAVNAAGGLPQHPFKPGDIVRLRNGALEGMEAIFVGPTTPAERVDILLRFLGREQKARVAPEELEVVANPLPADAHPPRRTRGKGRPITAQR